MGKRLKLGRDDRCVSCDVALPAGTTAYWFAAERHTKCVRCGAAGDPDHSLVAALDEASARADVAGGSARAEYEKRSGRERRRQEQEVADDAAWRQQVKAKHRVLGPVIAALTPKPVIAERQ